MHGSIYMEDQILGVPENNGSGTRLQDPEWKIPVHQMHEVAGKKQSLATLHTPADKKNNTIFFRTRFSAWHVHNNVFWGLVKLPVAHVHCAENLRRQAVGGLQAAVVM